MQNRGFKTLFKSLNAKVELRNRTPNRAKFENTNPNFYQNYSHIKKLIFTIKKHFNKKIKKNETIKGVFRIKITNSKLKILNLKKKEKLIFPGYLKKILFDVFTFFLPHATFFGRIHWGTNRTFIGIRKIF
jgi:hypothetical protein